MLDCIHPNTIPGLSDPPNPNVSKARFPSEEEKSAYERVAWQRLLESHEAGMGKSRVRVVQVVEEQGTGLYEEEKFGLKNGPYETRFVVLLQ
jgi:hypothetical protein